MEQKIQEMLRSKVYIEESLNFKIEDNIARCKTKNCGYETQDYFEAEDHWYTHYIW